MYERDEAYEADMRELRLEQLVADIEVERYEESLAEEDFYDDLTDEEVEDFNKMQEALWDMEFEEGY